MVDNVQQGAVHCQCVVVAQQTLHGNACENKADLRYRRAGKGALKINGEHRQHSTQHHGDHTQCQHQHAPSVIVAEYLCTQHQNTEYTRLDDDTGQHRRRRCRCSGVSGGQPDIQGEGARLCRKAHKGQQARSPQIALVFHCSGSLIQAVDFQCAQQMVQHKHTHQGRQTANDRHSQIGFRCTNGIRPFGVDDQYPGGKAHDFKEHEGGEQVRRQEHTHSAGQSQQPESIVTVAEMTVGKIFTEHQSRFKPTDGGDDRHQAAEAVRRKVQPQPQHSVDAQRRFAPEHQQQSRCQFHAQHHRNKVVALLFIVAADFKAHGRTQGREQNNKQ